MSQVRRIESINIDSLLTDVELPSSIEVLTKLQDWLKSDTASFDEFAGYLKSDPGLTARILRLANSAYYGGRCVDTVEQAMTLIGSNSLAILIMASEVVQAFSGSRIPNIREFWKHSIFAAVAGRVLAKSVKLSPEQLFTVGLLRGVGRLVFYIQLPEEAKSALQEAQSSDTPLYLIERNRYGFDHAALGAELLRRWELPETITEVIENYVEPEYASAEYAKATAVTHLAHSMMNRYYGFADFADDTSYLKDVTGMHDEQLMSEALSQVILEYSDTVVVFLG